MSDCRPALSVPSVRLSHWIDPPQSSQDKYSNNYDAMKGYGYLLTDGELYKIGVTRGSIENRISKLQTGNPYDIAIIDYFESEYPFKVEKMLHARHSQQRINNEWFNLENEDVRNFRDECIKCESIVESIKDNPWMRL